MSVLPSFVKKQVRNAFKSRIRALSSLGTSGEGKLTSNPAVVNYLLKTYETDNIFTETGVSIRRYVQKSNQSETKYSNSLWLKVLRVGDIYDD